MELFGNFCCYFLKMKFFIFLFNVDRVLGSLVFLFLFIKLLNLIGINLLFMEWSRFLDLGL